MMNILVKRNSRCLQYRVIRRLGLEYYPNRVRLQKLLQKDQKVHQLYLKENPVDMELIKHANYSINDTPEQQSVEITTTFNDHQILIQFKNRYYEDIDTESEDTEELESRESDSIKEKTMKMQQKEDKDVMDYVRFTVFITKNHNSIAYECVTVDGDLVVSNIVNLGGDMDSYKQWTRVERENYQYTGPQFNTLDDMFQKALIDYLKSFGIDDDLCDFIHQYSLDKESRLRLEWISKMLIFMK